jgi:hypothetical protein
MCILSFPKWAHGWASKFWGGPGPPWPTYSYVADLVGGLDAGHGGIPGDDRADRDDDGAGAVGSVDSWVNAASAEDHIRKGDVALVDVRVDGGFGDPFYRRMC